MSLAPGTRLGPYEVVSSIGVGGMGQVYKARDTRLNRPVALKVILAAVAADPDMRERFEREARAISALDHPHVCMLYDVCREVPSAGGEEPLSFLVMQYLEGETLADRIARGARLASDPGKPSSDSQLSTTLSRGPLSFDTAIQYGIEIAQALEAAHRRGIVHRDLKPGNIMLTRSGTKLLDFGLAKLVGDGPGVFGEGQTRTGLLGPSGAVPLTGQGTILGTLHYMAPEQLEGREVDQRTDIHAFGLVLYEMLTGRRAFDAQSQAGVIGAIMTGAAPSVSALADARTTLPAPALRALDRLIARCLAKDPDDRWQSAGDVADELKWINDERRQPVLEIAATAEPAVVPRTRERVWMGATAIALLGLVTVAYLWYPRPEPPPRRVAFTIVAAGDKPIASGPGGLALSPDGLRVAFIAGPPGPGSELWVRSLDSADAVRLDRVAGAWQPTWSPDGRSIVYGDLNGAQGLKRVDLDTGIPRTLTTVGGGRAGWNKDGVILFTDGGRLFRVQDSGGDPVLVAEPDASRQEIALRWPSFLPDGRRFFFISVNTDPAKTGLYWASLDSPSERTFVAATSSNVDVALGWLFYARDGTLFAQPFDETSGRVRGDASVVITGIRQNMNNGRAGFAVSTSGTLVYAPGESLASGNTRRRLTLFDRSGKPLQVLGEPGPFSGGTLSPDGRWVMAGEDPVDNRTARRLRLFDVARGVSTPFTVGEVDERNPVWSPDGASVVFTSIRDNRQGLFRRSAGGGATRDELLFSSEEPVLSATGFSFDGQRLLFVQGRQGSVRVWMLPLGGDRKAVEVFPGTPESRGAAVFSPDGKWIAYSAGVGTEDNEIYVQPFPVDDRRIRLSPASGRHPRWTRDGRQVIYRTNDEAIVSVAITPAGNTLQIGAHQTLFTEGRTPRGNYFSMDELGQRFVLAQNPRAGDSPEILNVILNFAAHVKANPR